MMQRHRRLHAPPSARPLTAMDACNQVWSADFIGHFRTQDGVLYDPFTLCDGYSRYLMRCQALDRPNWIRVRSILDAAFREYGVPEVIRTDNGPPFATASVTGLSRLTVWWITLGMIPERIEPGQPAQNGRHERLHRSVKAEATLPPAANLAAEQRVFHRFIVPMRPKARSHPPSCSTPRRNPVRSGVPCGLSLGRCRPSGAPRRRILLAATVHLWERRLGWRTRRSTHYADSQ